MNRGLQCSKNQHSPTDPDRQDLTTDLDLIVDGVLYQVKNGNNAMQSTVKMKEWIDLARTYAEQYNCRIQYLCPPGIKDSYLDFLAELSTKEGYEKLVDIIEEVNFK